MHKEVDFIEAHREEMRALDEIAGDTPPTKVELQRFKLERQLLDAQESQFKKVKNEEKWRRLEDVFYPSLCDIAEIQGGRVTLDIDEGALLGQLFYTGDFLTLDHSACMGLADFSALVSSADDLFVSVEDGYFQFQFLFDLYDQVQIADHSRKIAEIEKTIQCHRLARALYRELLGGADK